jgi:glycosyltransferase involved in cell wall biosynthesis
MKIAIFHNFLDNIGGAEIVTLTLARSLQADIYTTNIDQEKIKLLGFDTANIFSIGTVHLNAPFRQQKALFLFRHLNLISKYDFFIIAGDWAMSGAINNKPNLWYVHSPIREIWDLYEETRKNTVPWFARWFFDIWVKYNRYLNLKYVKHVNTLVCNSQNTQKRISRYLKRDADIIYPPIDTAHFHYETNGNYWLSVNRLINHKRIELQLEAFKNLPNEKLVIVGSYEHSRHFLQYAEFIKKNKPDNVEIVSWVDSKKLMSLYANCKGFITTAHDEDFGMTPVEAMASGKPAIAPNEGGYRETIVNGITGELIDNLNSDTLVDAINRIGQNPEYYKDACIKQAHKFSTEIFIEKIKSHL